MVAVARGEQVKMCAASVCIVAIHPPITGSGRGFRIDPGELYPHIVNCRSFLSDGEEFSMETVLPILVLASILVIICVAILSAVFRARTFAQMSIVQAGIEYPNNHHVMGVGYYHAASLRWFQHPWNEYREDRGYYWDGAWNTAPDQRMVQKSLPPSTEVERVNREWRKAGPDRTRQFWETVEREGFGTAIRRSEGS